MLQQRLIADIESLDDAIKIVEDLKRTQEKTQVQLKFDDSLQWRVSMSCPS
ncbi:MAG: hypothetical protein ABSD49_05235 [Candidatus Bathyarchaeia archaeon]